MLKNIKINDSFWSEKQKIVKAYEEYDKKMSNRNSNRNKSREK